LKNGRTCINQRRQQRPFSVIVIFGLTLVITGGIVPVSVLAQQQQQQNSTSNQSMMIELAKQNLTSTAVNMTTETNQTTTNNIKNVSIVPEATGLEDKAYEPNPITIKVGETITWINNDLSIHTVTEGNPSINVSANGFDSGLISPEETFQHTFDKVGNIEYHCALHPTMLGKIIVVV
jgi:plastocyanin